MRVLQILPELNVGGVERGVIDLSHAMKLRGEEVQVISNGGKLVSELVKMGVPHYELPVHRKSLWTLRMVKEVSKIIERERIDIIHARSRVPAWIAYLASRRTSCDFVTTCHGYYSKHFLSRVMGWGKRVIVISHSVGRRMIDDFHVPPERVRLIHRGIDLSQYAFDPSKYLKPVSDTFKIINIGRITPIKGQKEFIHGIHLLSKQIPNVEAWIVGAPDTGKEDYWNELKLLVDRLRLHKQVKFLGVRYDVPKLLHEADLLVLSTKIPEAFGRVIAEAGAVGTAVVASRIGGILDVIDEGKNGFLFYPLHLEEMVRAMAQLIRNRKQCYEFAHNLRKKVEDHFSLDLMLEKTLEVYREVRHEKKILVTKLGAVGDLTLAVPSFRMLRKRFPSASISLLVDSKLAPLVESCPYLNEIITFDRFRKKRRFSQLIKLARRLRERYFDLSIDLQNNSKTHWLTFLGRIPKRIGFARGFTGLLLTHPVKEPKQDLMPIQHQFELLKRAGVNQLDEALELWPDPASEAVIQAKFEKAGFTPEAPVVGLAIGSSRKWATKRWPIQNFLNLAKRLINECGFQIVLIGGQDDLKLSKEFEAHPFQKNMILNLIGKTNLPELISSIRRFDVLVTGDSAPMHIAAAMKVKLVVLFGPTEPKRHLPPGHDHGVFVKRIACQPCYQGVCRHKPELECLKLIDGKDVFEAVKRQQFLTSKINTKVERGDIIRSSSNFE
ncbi:MAG: lipopolysaccharide heptosyltransferase II [Candidatus Omnitrophica bacterium]|nr:lipopolysaccharide heptosyltransferase II [Candidatus Omnitrophota bacterium]